MSIKFRQQLRKRLLRGGVMSLFDEVSSRFNKVSTKKKQNDEKCKGLIFRGYSSIFYDDLTKRVEYKQGIKLLKRKSCLGCPQCFFFLDEMPDIIDVDCLIFPEGGIENGKLYTVIVTNISKDWETGCTHSWDFEIVKVKDNQGHK